MRAYLIDCAEDGGREPGRRGAQQAFKRTAAPPDTAILRSSPSSNIISALSEKRRKMEEGTETPEATDPGLNATSAIYQRHDRGRPSSTLVHER